MARIPFQTKYMYGNPHTCERHGPGSGLVWWSVGAATGEEISTRAPTATIPAHTVSRHDRRLPGRTGIAMRGPSDGTHHVLVIYETFAAGSDKEGTLRYS